MRTRSWRAGWGMLGILLLWAHGAIAAPDLEERVLQAIARHADREAAMTLVEAWQEETPGVVSPGSVALNEGLSGHYLTAKHLLRRVAAEKPDDKTLRLGALVLVLLEGNPPTCRQAIEELSAIYPENPQLERRYGDVLESMGLPAARLPVREEEPAAESPAEVPDPGTPPTPAPTPAPAAREIPPVQAESVREQLLRQLAESQNRQAREEEARQQRAKDEQARKRREEATRLAAERQRRAEAARQLAEEAQREALARQAAEKQARLASEKRRLEARQAAERTLLEKRKAAEATSRKTEQQRAAERSRLAADQKRRLEVAEQARWLSARNRPSAAPSRPPAPAPSPSVSAAIYVLKPQTIANRRVWIGEERASVHARLGRPRSADGPGVERYAGLSVWYDPNGKVATFELDSAWYAGPGGVRPGLTLREVLRSLPNSDGLFHLRATEPEATSSLYVLSTLDGTLAELQFNDEVWLSTLVRTTTPAGATHLYEELLRKGPVRRLTPDYVLALEARRKPLP